MKRHLIPISRCVLSLALFGKLICTASAATQNTTAGVWDGTISLPGTELVDSVNLQEKDGAWSGTIDIPMASAKGLPLSNISIDGTSISFSIDGVPGNPTFKGKLSEECQHDFRGLHERPRQSDGQTHTKPNGTDRRVQSPSGA
jgi:hypothetical protein